MQQVLNTAPFLERRFPPPSQTPLIELADQPEGFLVILANWKNILRAGALWEEQLQDYFALCLACHHATVATFVPTDVDTKIRGLLWRETRDPEILRPMLRLALQARQWTEEGISKRSVLGVSGHNGEHWSAIAGGLGWFLERGETTIADVAEEAIEAINQEIAREQAIFDQTANDVRRTRAGSELELMRLAMTMAHNRGDLTRGMGFWKNVPGTAAIREHFTTHGKFERAVHMYQKTGIAAEGHRHYPLRSVKALRQSPDTLLPLSPFLDDWGHKVMQLDDRHEVMEALIAGCQKVQGQEGYFRALAGMRDASTGEFERAAQRMSNGARRALRDGALRKKIDVPRTSWESMMAKRARACVL